MPLRIDCRGRVEEALDLKRWVVCEWIDRTSDYVFDIERRNNTEINLAINPDEWHVVDVIAKGRNITTLCRVHMNSDNVVASPIHVLCQLKGERRVAALVLAEFLSVDPNGRSRHYCFEIDKYPLTSCCIRQLEVATVCRNELILVVIERVPRQDLVRVRDYYVRERRVVELSAGIAFDKLRAEAPATIHRDHANVLSLRRLPFHKNVR